MMKRKWTPILNNKMKRILLILVIWLVFAGNQTVQGKTDNVIHFNDKKLEEAICSEFDCKAPITFSKRIISKMFEEVTALRECGNIVFVQPLINAKFRVEILKRMGIQIFLKY